ncbi:MAG: energy transducer TonB [Giesbergeria sp.]|uniref:energy transducer TonB n=1 Tax=Giesbergeria sp. TaxID=2818473 RepID=UPI0026175153|nr:energy transducer TonB [Giesbergeria sp.]MDD2610990.1 energy transducer TonB [Giesbergeria sp.]
MPSSDHFAVPTASGHRILIISGVVLAHAAGLWALEAGLVRQTPAQEVIVPATVLAELVPPPVAPTPPAPPPAPPVPEPPKPQPVVRPAALKTPAPKPQPAPTPVLNAPPAPNAPIVAASEPDSAPAVTAAPAPAPSPPAPPAPPAPPRIELPSSSAAYLQNPAPAYPAISKRMGEEGKVVLRVLIGADGLPQKVELQQSSGYDRLDRQAQEAVMRWRFVPGKRNGVPETMWNLVPINFVLE